MYYPYTGKKREPVAGAGSYYHAKADQPVPTAGLGGYSACGEARPGDTCVQSVRSPYFAQFKPWPYILGPNVTRPVFKEYTRAGNFKTQPIVRMPSLGEAPAQPAVEPPPVVEATPSKVCASLQAMPDVYERCMQFNAKLQVAVGAERDELMSRLAPANSECAAVNSFEPWARCYYARLWPKWYENPLYLGGAIVGGSALASLLVLALRRASE